MSAEYDLVIIGGGGAGLAAAQYGARANLKTLLIEQMASGGQALLIDNLENYPGLAKPISGYDFAVAMQEQAERFGATIENATVNKVTKKGAGFSIETDRGSYEAGAVLCAPGAKHRHLGVKGEEEFSGRGVSYCATCDGPFFKGKPMLVVGGGDAACDEAMYLSKLSSEIIMVHRRDRFRAQRALAERTLKNPSIKARFNTVVREIRGDTKVREAELENVVTGERFVEKVEAVFVFIGSDPQTALFPDAAKDETGSIITDATMMSSIPGLFAAGDVRATPFRQLVTACAEGAIAAHYAARYIEENRGEAYR